MLKMERESGFVGQEHNAVIVRAFVAAGDPKAVPVEIRVDVDYDMAQCPFGDPARLSVEETAELARILVAFCHGNWSDLTEAERQARNA